MSNLNPQASDLKVYTAYNRLDRSQSLMVVAAEDVEAKFKVLDKIGYWIVEDTNDRKRWNLVDADDISIVEAALKSADLEDAYNEALGLISWTVTEPTELIGGSLGAGFGLEEQ